MADTGDNRRVNTHLNIEMRILNTISYKYIFYSPCNSQIQRNLFINASSEDNFFLNKTYVTLCNQNENNYTTDELIHPIE